MTAVVGAPASFETAQPMGRAGMRRAMAAEWTKLWSVRSTMWTLVATVVAVVGLCALSTGTVNSSEIIGDPTSRSLIGVFLGQLIFGVLGVLVMSAEYGTGTIRATLSEMCIRDRPGGAQGPAESGLGDTSKALEVGLAKPIDRGQLGQHGWVREGPDHSTTNVDRCV